jgi:hypothetical protein
MFTMAVAYVTISQYWQPRGHIGGGACHGTAAGRLMVIIYAVSITFNARIEMLISRR